MKTIFAFIFITDYILGIRNLQINERCDSGYKFTLLTLSKNCGFAVPIFPSLIFSKKMADTTYCGPPFILFLRYLGIS